MHAEVFKKHCRFALRCTPLSRYDVTYILRPTADAFSSRELKLKLKLNIIIIKLYCVFPLNAFQHSITKLVNVVKLTTYVYLHVRIKTVSKASQNKILMLNSTNGILISSNRNCLT